MHITKSIELILQLKDWCLSKNIPILEIGQEYLAIQANENSILPNRSIHIELGDWAAPHTITVYQQEDWTKEKQISYSHILGYGDYLEHLKNIYSKSNHHKILSKWKYR